MALEKRGQTEQNAIFGYIRRLWPMAWFATASLALVILVATGFALVTGRFIGGTLSGILTRITLVTALVVTMGFGISAYLDWRWRRLTRKGSRQNTE